GSQGARCINDLAMAGIEKGLAGGARLIVQTGAADYGRVLARVGAGGAAAVLPFHNRVSVLYSAADVAVARAGAMSLTELSYFGLPSILVPYPYAADDHQTANAEEYCREGCGMTMRQGGLSAEDLWRRLRSLLADPGALSGMRAACARLASVNGSAARLIAERLLRLREGGAP
ncbi:UDP-N-acetylglucosamine--N-acetylmuramyl-(pentapeptide) pyrophosphoryl-undecaprenol N-acetylglucosamine transferase, partial [Candidatus Fermentibacterales bacterium]|nr:UDP-N-acetylglucosamine--N-acetylmuramyl-(pentapeptide) pyrophosphoryl-undecaprenol N-acetylglucosamine transferase [Candidatus Fermentibacterales bacterium]